MKRPRRTTRIYDKIRSGSSVAHKGESGLLSPIRGKGCNAGALDVTQRYKERVEREDGCGAEDKDSHSVT